MYRNYMVSTDTGCITKNIIVVILVHQILMKHSYKWLNANFFQNTKILHMACSKVKTSKPFSCPLCTRTAGICPNFYIQYSPKYTKVHGYVSIQLTCTMVYCYINLYNHLSCDFFSLCCGFWCSLSPHWKILHTNSLIVELNNTNLY